MLPLLSAAQMRACDEYTINEKHVPSQQLMERAARASSIAVGRMGAADSIPMPEELF